MSPNDNKGEERNLDRFGGRVPEPLRDELSQLYDRGYSQADVFSEGVRSLSDLEGIWRRRREFAVGTLVPPAGTIEVATDKAPSGP